MVKIFETYNELNPDEGWKERVTTFYGISELSDLNAEQAAQVWSRLQQQGKIKEAQNGE